MPKKKEESTMKFIRRGTGRTATSSRIEHGESSRPSGINSGEEGSSGSKQRSTSESSSDEFAFMRDNGHKKPKRLRRDVSSLCRYM